MNQHRVLADPTQARALGKLAIRHRTVVDPGMREPGTVRLQPLRQNVQAAQGDDVIVHAAGVRGDLECIARRGPLVGGRRVVLEHHDRRARARRDRRRMLPLPRLAMEVSHRSAVAGSEPAVERVSTRTGIEPRDAARDKADPQRLGLHLVQRWSGHPCTGCSAGLP